MRASGVLLAISSLPSRYGIGCFSKEAYDFVDFLVAAGQKHWQILPLGPTGYGDSPYQSFSTFAGNPYFIDPETLIEEGLLTKKDCACFDFGTDPQKVDYEKIGSNRFKLLRIAFENSRLDADASYKTFVHENKAWLPDYALYMALKGHFKGLSWNLWDEDIRLRKKSAVDRYRKELSEEIAFYQFQQYHFDKQGKRLKAYANKKGITIVGDIPIYVAFDSADTWANPKQFQLDRRMIPNGVAGVPPDAFSATGQLWGNPLYDWSYHQKTGYEWWLRRIRHCAGIYDIIRIDHFRGFDSYWSVPYGDETAQNGHWEEGPGYDFFRVIKSECKGIRIIAEDLGILTPAVNRLVKKTGYPGMKILQFAFYYGDESSYLPHNHVKNCIVYTGTHDNDTTVHWYKSLNRKDQAYLRHYLNIKNTRNVHWDLIRCALSSVADTVIIPMQDYLGLDGWARMNTPSTLGGNWEWRMQGDALTEDLSQKIHDMTTLYGR